MVKDELPVGDFTDGMFNVIYLQLRLIGLGEFEEGHDGPNNKLIIFESPNTIFRQAMYEGSIVYTDIVNETAPWYFSATPGSGDYPTDLLIRNWTVPEQ